MSDPLSPSCTQTACFIQPPLTYLLCQFIYSDTICIYAWKYAEKGLPMLWCLSCCTQVAWLSCWFWLRDAIWSRESFITTIVTRRLLLKYSQSGWRSNKSSKSNAISLARSLCASAQLYKTNNTTLWFQPRERVPSAITTINWQSYQLH